jgi:uncharacterized membrane protein YhaH (DUF805 family)
MANALHNVGVYFITMRRLHNVGRSTIYELLFPNLMPIALL